MGGGQDGCLDCSKFTVAVLEGAMPLDSNMLQAFPISLSGLMKRLKKFLDCVGRRCHEIFVVVGPAYSHCPEGARLIF